MKLLLAIGLAALAYAYAVRNNGAWSFEGGPMDGTVWEVRVRPDSWFSFSHKDTLVFDSGRLAAAGYMAAGFSAGAYSVAGVKGRYSWQSSLRSPNDGTLEWTGHVEDDRIEGVIARRGPDGRIRRLRFKGTRRLS